MPTKLSLYNGALLVLGEEKLASLSEAREPRYVLDTIWDDGLVRYLLGRGLWNHAMRTQRLDYDPDITPDFGLRRAFEKPADWVRTAGVASDEYFNYPLTRYADEAGYWYADIDELYVRFVSDDSSYGGDYSLWPENFTLYAEHFMAWRACSRLTQSKVDKQELARDTKKLLTEARSTDAMNEPTSFPPSGSWSGARAGRWGRRERSGGQLIG